MNQPNRLKNIPVTLPYKSIYVRLGHHQTKSNIPETQKSKIDQYINEAFELCDNQAVWNDFRFTLLNGDTISIEDYKIQSKKLWKFIENSEKILLIASTVGEEIVQKRDHYMKTGNMTKAVIYDAVAAETADSILDWIRNYLIQKFLRSGYSLTKFRISPGYHDLSLSVQKWIFQQLLLEEIGLNLTDSMIIIPEKSVTAFYGLIKLN